MSNAPRVGGNLRGKGPSSAANEMLARVSHLYYILGLTQVEIAERLKITRFKVHRLLAQARESGMVRVRINLPFAEWLELEAALIRRYGLAAAYVCPSETSAQTPLSAVIGQYAATILANLLRDGQTVTISWGSTLRAMATTMEAGTAQNLSVVSMIGSLATRSCQDKYEAASVLADRLGAECFYLPGPILCDSVAAKQAIHGQPAVQSVLERARRADVALMSLGGTHMSSIRQAGVISDSMYHAAMEAGAIGNFLGRFINAQGAVIEHPMNGRCLGVGPEDIGGIATRILCAGGPHKVAAIGAVLRRKSVTVLITDKATARSLIEQP